MVTVKKGPCTVYPLYIPLDDFCIDMPDEGLSTGRNV
jgi:hypothetical protein